MTIKAYPPPTPPIGDVWIPQPDLGIGKFKEKNAMDIWMIWAVSSDEANDAWLVAAWDDESVMGNREGWLEAVADAEEEHGGRFVRITKTSVDYDAVLEAFLPPRV